MDYLPPVLEDPHVVIPELKDIRLCSRELEGNHPDLFGRVLDRADVLEPRTVDNSTLRKDDDITPRPKSQVILVEVSPLVQCRSEYPCGK